MYAAVPNGRTGQASTGLTGVNELLTNVRSWPEAAVR